MTNFLPPSHAQAFPFPIIFFKWVKVLADVFVFETVSHYVAYTGLKQSSCLSL